MIDQIEHLRKNKKVFLDLLKEVPQDMIPWRSTKDTWCLLEVICHLYDEECHDFRFRVKWLLEKPGETPPPFDPLDWVTEHRYMEQDFQVMLHKFIAEREQSIRWLNSLHNPNWSNGFEHAKFGKLTATYFLNNWLAHDYLHMRQIIKLKFDYLNSESGTNLNYAGLW